ncbi:hypothetical protein QZQ56_16525 [Serratia marcescens]|uniref:hypothetical protein n=1 Tax=Serratia marcescens TaxID=615 RepID=UPI0018D74903|nr:hypothetical protein [Serratia marcescens]MBH2589629.1 hypothetical protein [Serratia marcescens]MBN5285093.1 hypothetical protein [Serratia marcescens]MDP8839986.1 hypothetical protein [Serratia marcescens]HEJ6997031.1 hypothetical protein [Serratia marcescens]
MDIQHGIIYDSVITDSLDAIPEGVEADLNKIMSFYEWREKGGYLVSGSNKKEFYLSCAARELGGVLLKEATSLNNQALEHKTIIGSAIASGKTLSSSWLLVTTYYWCVYLVLSWLRMTGQVVTYLPSEEITRFNKLNPSNNKFPQNGTFITKFDDTSGSRAHFKLQRLKSNNFHEGLWVAFNNDIVDRLELFKDKPADIDLRALSCLNLSKFADGHSWPSKIRNIVNYKVGFGYDEINGLSKPNMLRIGSQLKSLNLVDIIGLHEENQLRVSSLKVEKSIDKYSELLLTFGTILSSLQSTYLKEICSRRNVHTSINERYLIYLGHHSFEPDGDWIKIMK